MYIKQFIIGGLSALLLGCIGVNPDDTKTTTTPAPATPATTTPATTTPAATTTSLTTTDGKPIDFMYTSTSHPTLHMHYLEFNTKNKSLDQRNQRITEANLAVLIKDVDNFSVKNLWRTQNGAADVPPTGAFVTIKPGSVALIDASYSLAQTTLEKNSGLYLSEKGELLAQTFEMQNDSWMAVPVGRIGAQSLLMNENAILDLIGGNGCILQTDLKDLKVEESNPKGVLTIGDAGSADLNKSFISAHKVEQQGDIKAYQTTFNLLPVTTGNYTNVEYLHQKGKIYPSDGVKPDFFFQVNGLYKLKPDAVIEMFIYTSAPPTAARVILKNQRAVTTPPADDDKPSIEGKFLLTPTSSTLENEKDIVLMDSDIEFTSTTITNVTRLLHEASQIIAGKAFSLKMSPNNKQILLDIKNAPISLKATTQVQTAINTLKHAELKADAWNTDHASTTGGKIANIEVFAINSTLTTGETSASSKLFGLKHSFDLASGNLVFTQTFNRAQVVDTTYRFIPQAQNPFWMMQHTIKFNAPFNFEHITITPAAGISHLMIADTLFQNGFQTLNPEMSLKFGINHTVDSSSLSINILTNAQYQTFNKQPRWGIDTGLNVNFNTPYLSIATGLINPFQCGAEMYLNVQTDF